MRLLLSILAAVFVLVPAGAHAQSNGPPPVPPTEAVVRVGEAALAAAAEGRCEAAATMLASIPRRHRTYRQKLAADPAMRACEDDDEAPRPAPVEVPRGEVDEGHQTLSLTATAGAWTAIAFGLALSAGTSGAGTREDVGEALVLGGAIASLVAPSFGHWAAGKAWTRGLTMRSLAVVGAGAAGLVIVMNALACDCESGGAHVDEQWTVVAVLAGALYAIGTIDDILTADRPARREPRWQVTPTVMTAPAGPVAGFAAAGRF